MTSLWSLDVEKWRLPHKQGLTIAIVMTVIRFPRLEKVSDRKDKKSRFDGPGKFMLVLLMETCPKCAEGYLVVRRGGVFLYKCRCWRKAQILAWMKLKWQA